MADISLIVRYTDVHVISTVDLQLSSADLSTASNVNFSV